MKPQTIADVDPDVLYDPADAARVLELHIDSIYRMGARGVLRRTPVGPRGGKTKFLGSEIRAYYYRTRMVA